MVNELTAAELKDLLNTFESDRRKLSYRLQQIDKTISDLQLMINRYSGVVTEVQETEIEEAEETPVYKQQEEVVVNQQAASNGKRRGRRSRITQAAVDTTPTPQKVKSTRKSSKKAKGYRLSEWDEALMEGLKKAKHPLINQELYELLEAKNLKENHQLDEKDLRGKLNRSLHKLANKREELIKVDHVGKGFAYALRRWVTPEGELKDKFVREAEAV